MEENALSATSGVQVMTPEQKNKSAYHIATSTRISFQYNSSTPHKRSLRKPPPSGQHGGYYLHSSGLLELLKSMSATSFSGCRPL